MRTGSTSMNNPIPLALLSQMPTSGKIALRMLEKLGRGSLKLTVPGGHTLTFGDTTQQGLDCHHANLEIHHWRVCSQVMKSGDIGFAESYMDQDWSTDNLPELLKLFVANRQALEQVIYGSWIGRLGYQLKHWLNRNTKAQAKKNIHAHYDLGNAFYSQWLDPSMTYSSAIFSHPGQSLQEAQQTKYQRALAQLRLKSGASLLEIGCGWGGFAQLAAESGHKTTGITLSTEQLAWSQERMQKQALEHQSEFLIRDYRDTHGQFDGIVSIEMFEAVGEQYWDSYFGCVKRNLKLGARACVQTITIAEELFERYRVGTDFIQQYIFPGGMLPSPSQFKALAKKHRLTVETEFSFGTDYAQTLAQWRDTFLARWDSIAPLGFDLRFQKTWEFYLAYCEAAFAKGNTDVFQFTLVNDGK
jgi:cyclopropane-fatty-acyl-phospholipid synthase